MTDALGVELLRAEALGIAASRREEKTGCTNSNDTPSGSRSIAPKTSLAHIPGECLMPRGSQDRRRRLSDVHRAVSKKDRASSSHIGFLEHMMIKLI